MEKNRAINSSGPLSGPMSASTLSMLTHSDLVTGMSERAPNVVGGGGGGGRTGDTFFSLELSLRKGRYHYGAAGSNTAVNLW